MASGRERFDFYALRIIESMLRRISLEDILAGRGLEEFDLNRPSLQPSLGAISMLVDGQKAIALDFILSPLAKNLVSLLHYFETRDQTAFQKVLKDLLDLFNIRFDEFDRVRNEAAYLQTMASGKNDKKRLMDFVKGPTVLEVGPAGGAILDLLEEVKHTRGGIERIIGLDISEEALKDLEVRRKNTSASYELLQGDAFELRKVLHKKGIPALDSIVFSSILHEIYSYGPRQFDIDSVRAMLGESLEALGPGGRLIIRDGVIPEDGETWQVMEIKDQNSFDFFNSYISNFEGRKIPLKILSNELDAGKTARIRIQRKDAMEFMYTLTWGPESFPYEVREQYGVLKRSEYVRLIHNIAAERGIPVLETPVPPEWRSYLQQGYVRNLQDKVALFDEDGQEAPFPPSNMILVFEKKSELKISPKKAGAVSKVSLRKARAEDVPKIIRIIHSKNNRKAFGLVGQSSGSARQVNEYRLELPSLN
ncbi:MAG: methyltransferase domain-containing protein [Elusimicrobia bacterium]|nr:methyltransferase domain-containing protein [Elusimicrobiota bacterium]